MIIQLQKSRLLTTIVLATHAGALLLLPTLPVGTPVRLGLASLILASLAWHWWRGALTAPGELHIGADGSCRLASDVRPDERRYRIAQAAVHAGVARLRLESADRPRRTVLILPDAVDADGYRHLRALIVQRRLPVREAEPGQGPAKRSGASTVSRASGAGSG